MIKHVFIICISAIVGTILYGALRSYSVDLDAENIIGRPCSVSQKIVDTVISRNCSLFLE